jgi:hypothetical protein
VAIPAHPLVPRRDSFLSALTRPSSAPPPPSAKEAASSSAPSSSSSAPPGEPVLLFFGIIDFLQSYNARKAAEHAVKTVAYGPRAMSVVNPRAYAARFMGAMERLFVEGEGGGGRPETAAT